MELGRASNLCWRSGRWCSFGSISSAFLFLRLSGAHRTGVSAFVVLEAPSFSSVIHEIMAGELPKLVFLRMSSYGSPAGPCPTGELCGGAGRQLGRVGGRGVGKGEKCPWGWLVLEEGRQGVPGSAACSVPSTCCTVVRGTCAACWPRMPGPREGASPPPACCRFRNHLLGQWQERLKELPQSFSLAVLF